VPEGEVRGIVVYVPSLVPEFESGVVKTLRRRGWAVVSTPGTELVLSQSRVRTTWWIGLEADDMAEGSKEASKEDRIQRLTSRAADVTRNLVGLTAEAYRAGLRALERDEPRIAGKPVIVAGFSLGAILAPGVVERLATDLGPRLRGVVLVGGGADIAGILRDSALTDLREALDWGLGTIEEIDDERFEKLRAEYLAKAKLDPYALAPRVGRFPTLVLHARGDGIVPARYGELLWERLGKPERWSWGYGHQLLFWRLDGYADRIGEWMEERAR
ncbi:MAG: alpha/beta hydrolase, partial [Planctomycetota bacterium]|nr:alpha/beta hydrolase [Planctomycetota bacterium]